MVDSLGMMSGLLPKMSGMGNTMIYIGTGLFVAALLSAAIILYYYNKKFDKIVVLFRVINNELIRIATHKATFERIGIAGDYWMFVRGVNKRLVRPKILISKNEFWYFEREDGEWINFKLQNIDEEMKQAKVFYLDEDMRLGRIGIEKILKSRLQKESFWAQYGTTIMSLIYIIVMSVFIIIILGKIMTLMDKSGVLIDLASKAVNAACRGGSNLVQVNMSGGRPI